MDMTAFVDIFLDAALDAIKDTLTLIPFLYLTYLAMEALEHSAAGWSQRVVSSAGKLGPFVGALVGALPQCGFSAMAATLFSARVVTLGTLLAVFLSTSDEMLPVFIANAAPPTQILAIIGFKVVVGMACGFLIDAVLRKRHAPREAVRIDEMCEHDHCGCGHGTNHASIWYSALIHTLQVTLFIFLISFALDVLIGMIGTDIVGDFLFAHPQTSVFLSALVGLIPNCAASVVISELYLDGILSAGPMIAGLLVGAGVGLLVLFRSNRPMKQNFAIIAILYGIGCIVGLLVNAIGLVF